MTKNENGSDNSYDSILRALAQSGGKVVVMTGAGISAESGVPTFRGPEGYWRIGSRNYQPTELATYSAFCQMPDQVWAWYLYRRSVCNAAQPNPSHIAVARFGNALDKRQVLITQNVNGLHLRAGSPLETTYQIHGNVDYMRCSRECTPDVTAIPEEVERVWSKERELGDAERELLRCPRCGERARPHVLWFDEMYDEIHFRFESALRAAAETDLLIVVGTTGATNLPMQVGGLVARRKKTIVVINPEPNPFTDFAAAVPNGVFLQGTAGQYLPSLLERIIEMTASE